MRDVSRDGLVRPDELLLHLQAIPMRSPMGEGRLGEIIHVAMDHHLGYLPSLPPL